MSNKRAKANLNHVNTQQLRELIQTSAEIGKTIAVFGAPGCGKTAITRDVLRKAGREVIYECAAYLTQINIGLPCPDDGWLRVLRERRWFKEYGKPMTIIMDEVDKLSPMMQQQICQLAHERRLGDDRLPEGSSIVLIGNRAEDGNGSYGASNILTSRTMNISFTPENDEIFAYGQKASWHPMVLAVLQMNKSLCYKPDSGQDRFPSPRTWENASAYLAATESRELWPAILSGHVGDVAAGEATAYIEAYTQLIPADECLTKPTKAKVPKAPHVRMLQAFIVAQQARPAQMGAAVEYLQRMPAEVFLSSLSALAANKSPAALLKVLNDRGLVNEAHSLML